MNRLVIVGNGFDLAHGLPTSYGHFINWYWKDLVSKIDLFPNESWKPWDFSNDELEINFKFQFPSKYGRILGYQPILDKFSNIDSFKTFQNFIIEHELSEDNRLLLNKHPKMSFDDCEMTFKSDFFELINEKHQIQNWVDIENEYYRLLKECLKEENNEKVLKLNKEFHHVKNLLEKYLNEEIIAKYDFKTVFSLGELLNHFEVRPRSLENDTYLEEFPNSHHEALKKQNEEIIQYSQERTLQQKIWNGTISENNLILNFNYTYSADKLKSAMNNDYSRDIYGKSDIIQIHGRLNDPENKINFGFGDEMDNHYQQIEEKDDNEYLKFIKSFQYLQNSNYKKVLDYIESDVFQVYIMGHSCGLSDRILLNTIFEHTNCVSIKVFYHQKEDGTDNYTEIVQNISRHFNKKKMMRDKIVNKSLCVPLPQNIRFEKK